MNINRSNSLSYSENVEHGNNIENEYIDNNNCNKDNSTIYSHKYDYFINKNFIKDDMQALSQILRKSSLNQKKRNKRKDIDIAYLTKEAFIITKILEDYNNYLHTHKEKANFLELCNKEITIRNNNARITLLKLAEHERNLEKYLLIALSNLSPNLFNLAGNNCYYYKKNTFNIYI